MTKKQYQLSTGIWTIAECDRCGRGFVRVGGGVTRDPYLPERGSRYFGQTTPCGGRIKFLEPVESPQAAGAVDPVGEVAERDPSTRDSNS
jgi:hypothetical protein